LKKPRRAGPHENECTGRRSARAPPRTGRSTPGTDGASASGWRRGEPTGRIPRFSSRARGVRFAFVERPLQAPSACKEGPQGAGPGAYASPRRASRGPGSSPPSRARPEGPRRDRRRGFIDPEKVGRNSHAAGLGSDTVPAERGPNKGRRARATPQVNGKFATHTAVIHTGGPRFRPVPAVIDFPNPAQSYHRPRRNERPGGRKKRVLTPNIK